MKKSFEDLLDPELIPASPEIIASVFDAVDTDMTAARTILNALTQAGQKMLPPFSGTIEKFQAPGLDHDPEIDVITYRQKETEHPDAALIWLHGGGHIMGTAEDSTLLPFAKIATVFSVEYRLSPEHPEPCAVRDACAVIDYIAKNAGDLNVDPAKIIIGGMSAGAGVATGATIMNRDRNGPALKAQFLLSAMLDDRHDKPSAYLDVPRWAWTREISLKAWQLYCNGARPSPYAAPMRAEDLSGLPQAYLSVGSLDIFRDEVISYAQKLLNASVAADMTLFAGAHHGFEVAAPMANVSMRAIANHQSVLRKFCQ